MQRINMKCNSFDFLSPEPSIYIKSKQGYVTISGIVFSVIFFFSFFSIFIFFFVDFINGTGMRLIEYIYITISYLLRISRFHYFCNFGQEFPNFFFPLRICVSSSGVHGPFFIPGRIRLYREKHWI